jgi:ferrous iron transport protein A
MSACPGGKETGRQRRLSHDENEPQGVRISSESHYRQQAGRTYVTETPMTLNRLTPGQSARVGKVGGAGAVRRRLMDMGIIRGTEIAVVKASPMGDPVEYRVRGYHLSLRRSEAELIEITL